MRYWWVNHKQTVRQEIGGGYLWSPKREANDVRSQFYENMRIAEPGDIVLSFATGFIRHIGFVQDFASPALKPDGFGSTGDYWSNDGWLLPLKWQVLSPPIRPKDEINKLAPLLPKKYSPIHPVSGKGNQKAYLAEIPKQVFEFLMGFTNLGSVPGQELYRGIGASLARIEDTVEKIIIEDPGLDSTTKQQLVLARHGQGLFRGSVFDFEKACRLTNVSNPGLLIASHIKPWRVCSTAAERLDGANGLLLTPHVDRLFDRGFISFSNTGDVIVSSHLDRIDLERLGLHAACAKGCGSFKDRQINYLEFHRSNVLLT